MTRATVHAVKGIRSLEGIEIGILTRLKKRAEMLPDDSRLDSDELVDALENPVDDTVELDEAASRMLSEQVADIVVGESDSRIMVEDMEIPDVLFIYNSELFPHIRYTSEGVVVLTRDVARTILRDVDMSDVRGDEYVVVNPV